MALGAIGVALGIGFFFYTMFSKGDWDWKKITIMVLSAISTIAMFLQILSLIIDTD